MVFEGLQPTIVAPLLDKLKRLGSDLTVLAQLTTALDHARALSLAA